MAALNETRNCLDIQETMASQVLQETRKLNKKELEKNGEKAELNIYYSVKYNLNLMVLEKILEDKNPEEVKNICMAYLNRMKAKKNEKI